MSTAQKPEGAYTAPKTLIEKRWNVNQADHRPV